MIRRSRRHTHRTWAAPLVVLLALVALPLVSAKASADVFPDVPFSHPFAAPIDWAVIQGVAAGFSDDTFRPAAPVTRQAMAAFLFRIENPGAPKPLCPAGPGPFGDVASDHPFCGEITWMADQGLSEGFPDGTYRPGVDITRQAMAAFLFRIENPGAPKPLCPAGPGPFGDVASDHPFCGEITWMADQGLSGGFPDGTYRPTVTTTRQATVTFLWRLGGEPAGLTARVSTAPDGGAANNSSSNPALSANGVEVAFESRADNLGPGGTPSRQHIYVRNVLGDTSAISVGHDGTESDNFSYRPTITPDGRYVAFHSLATNLVAGGTNGEFQVLVRDREFDDTVLVSVASNGNQGNATSVNPAISANGRFVAFDSDATNLVTAPVGAGRDVFVHDLATGVTTLVSVNAAGNPNNGADGPPSISADGRYVAFSSAATDLVAGDTNGARDVFVRDRHTGVTTRVSVASDGTQGDGTSTEPSISADGRYVAFRSQATNLAAGVTNGLRDLYVHDRHTGVTTRVSVASNGTEANGASENPVISADGRVVAFRSVATNLVAGVDGDSDVFVHNRITGRTTLASAASDGSPSDGPSYNPAISADGRVVAFASEDAGLAAGDGSEADIYFRLIYGGG